MRASTYFAVEAFKMVGRRSSGKGQFREMEELQSIFNAIGKYLLGHLFGMIETELGKNKAQLFTDHCLVFEWHSGQNITHKMDFASLPRGAKRCQ